LEYENRTTLEKLKEIWTLKQSQETAVERETRVEKDKEIMVRELSEEIENEKYSIACIIKIL
jgi:hypothetical protein